MNNKKSDKHGKIKKIKKTEDSPRVLHCTQQEAVAVPQFCRHSALQRISFLGFCSLQFSSHTKFITQTIIVFYKNLTWPTFVVE